MYSTEARKINYLPKAEDDEMEVEDPDSSECGSEYETSTEEPKFPEAASRVPEQPRSLEFVIKCHKEDKEANSDAAADARTLITNFCARTSVTSVAPTIKELDEVWSEVWSGLDGMSNPCRALVVNAVIFSLADQFSSELVGHDWKPQLRALHMLQFFYCKGGLERYIAESVVSESSEVLQHLSTEVIPLREKALQVIELSRHAENVPVQEGLVVCNGGGIFVLRKRSVDQGDDQETNPGSSSQADTSSEQEEHFVPGWPTSPKAFASPRPDGVLSDLPEDSSIINIARTVHGPTVQVAELSAAVSPVILEGSAVEADEVLPAEKPALVNYADDTPVEAPCCIVELPAIEAPAALASIVENLLVVQATSLHKVEEVGTADVALPCSLKQDALDFAFSEPDDPFAMDHPFAELFDPFADLAAGSLLSVAAESSVDECFSKPKWRAGSDDSSTSMGSTRAGSISSIGSAEDALTSRTLNELMHQNPSRRTNEMGFQKPGRKTMPVIQWGIEDEMAAPADPFASLTDRSLFL